MKKWISSGYALTLFAALASASEAQAEHYTIPLLVPATTFDAPQGVLRILNRTQESGTVQIYAIDDAGTRSGPAIITLNASAAVELGAQDLQSGNAAMGLTGGIGADVGDARLAIETDLHIEPLAYVRAADGTLSAMHDTAREFNVAEFGYDTGHQYRYDVPIFNPASDATQVSRLRLINPGDGLAAVTISGRDDSGAAASGGDVTLTLAAGAARTLTVQQLEAGDSIISGQLGAGVGKWRLTVSSDRPLQVVNLVAATAGYLNNLSTTAVRGAAPTDQAALNERFVGVSVIYETGNGRFTLNAMAGDRFTETGESDGVSTTFMGSYSYVGIGPDAGRLTLDYDDGDECRANFYFSSRTSGWFASHCTGSDAPDGYWLGGNWFVEDPGDTSPSFAAMSGPGDQTYTVGTAIETLTLPEASGGDGALTYSLSPNVPGLSFDATTRQFVGTPPTAGTYAMTYTVMDEDGDAATLEFNITVSADSSETGSGRDCHVGQLVTIGESCTYPGTMDEFTVNVRGRGQFLTFLAGIRIRVNNQTINERVYDFEASHQGDGVWRIDRVAGSTEPPTADTSPSFGAAGGPGNQTFTAGIAINELSLPAASGGNGDLNYTLSPNVPGLSFDGSTRQLTGTPSAAGTYAMTYTVTDSDGDTDTRTFTITVASPGTVAVGDCYVGQMLGAGESCTYPGTDDAFTVDEMGRGSFLSLLADIAIRINEQTINGRVYDFAVSPQGDSVWRIDRIAGSTEPPTGGGDMGTDQELYRGIRVAPENRCSVYDSGDYYYPPSVEDQIVADIGKIYSPYTGECFVTTGETDIEHIVARSEAHDSGLCAASTDTKSAFARDLLNLTLASPAVNRFQKSAKDVAEWLPSLNACWFVARTLEVRRKYDLTIDRREADAVERTLAMCASAEMIVRDCETPQERPQALVLWDDNGDGRITCAEARAHGIAPVHRGHPAYPFMDDRDNDGVVCE